MQTWQVELIIQVYKGVSALSFMVVGSLIALDLHLLPLGVFEPIVGETWNLFDVGGADLRLLTIEDTSNLLESRSLRFHIEEVHKDQLERNPYRVDAVQLPFLTGPGSIKRDRTFGRLVYVPRGSMYYGLTLRNC